MVCTKITDPRDGRMESQIKGTKLTFQRMKNWMVGTKITCNGRKIKLVYTKIARPRMDGRKISRQRKGRMESYMVGMK